MKGSLTTRRTEPRRRQEEEGARPGEPGGRGHRPRQEVGRRFFLEEMRALGAVSTGHEGASTALHPEDLAIPGTPQGAVKR